MPEEWDPYKFELGSAGQELVTVRHIAHVPFARRIIEDGKIKAGLVYDKSRLNTSRISVAWVSANTWGLGSIYGTVEFRFSWADIIADQRIYWVEAMPEYRPYAYRLLLSKRDINSPLIKSYDPSSDEGPLRFKDGRFFWNNNYTSEFMIEDDLSLDRCTGIGFLTHHRDYCGPFGNACEDRRFQPETQVTGGRILAFILARELHGIDVYLKDPNLDPRFRELETAYDGLLTRLSDRTTFEGPIATEDECQRIILGSLAHYGADLPEQARKLLSLISSGECFQRGLKAVVQKHFNDPAWEPTP